MTKKLISIITSIIMCIGCFSISASAKVIEPEIVKTEKWTTSYYIDDDIETLYPYIQFEADIYNDGTIMLYMWNTHEWDGFATVKHDVTIVQTAPMQQNSNDYLVAHSIQSGEVVDHTYYTKYSEKRYTARLISDYHIIDVSYYSNSYSCSYSYIYNAWDERQKQYNYAVYDEYFDGSFSNYGYLKINKIYVALPNITPNTRELWYTFKPTVDPTGTYKFRLYGHDITITPELLSGNIVAEPELTDQEKRIKELEEENAKLKASITNTSLFGDINGDNLVDVADAQMILNYYVYTLVSSNAESLEEWISKQ